MSGGRQSCGQGLLSVGIPMTAQEFVQPGLRHLRDATDDIDEPSRESTSLSFAVPMRLYIAAARPPPVSYSANTREP